MSELKAYRGDVYIPVYGSIADAKVYLKSEADKAITELEESHRREANQLLMTILELKEKLKAPQLVTRLNTTEALYSNLETMSRLTHEKYTVERREIHQKYKRCLAMAKYCEAMRGHYLSYEEPKWFWYRKWSEHWQGLAEKFKEAK